MPCNGTLARAGSAHPPDSAQCLLHPAVGLFSSSLLLCKFPLFQQPLSSLIIPKAALTPMAVLSLVWGCQAHPVLRQKLTGAAMPLGIRASPFSAYLISTWSHFSYTLECLWRSGSFFFCGCRAPRIKAAFSWQRPPSSFYRRPNARD